MEASTFDRLLRRAAQHATRRKALAALLGAAVLLGDPDVGDATKKAKRRKHRKKRDRTKPRPVWAWVDNTAGTTGVVVSHNRRTIFRRCEHQNTVTVLPGTILGFASDTQFLGLMFVDRYWLDFYNPNVGLPSVSAAVDGVALSRQELSWREGPWTCAPQGRTKVNARKLNEYEFVNAVMEGPVFHVRRNFDMANYKSFTVTLPAQILPDA